MTIKDKINAAATITNAKAYDEDTEKYLFCLDLLDLCLGFDGDDYCDRAIGKLETKFDQLLNTDFLVRSVRKHAAANYNVDGWDIVIECWDDKEIAEAIGPSRTVSGAIKKIRRHVKPVYDRQNRPHPALIKSMKAGY